MNTTDEKELNCQKYCQIRHYKILKGQFSKYNDGIDHDFTKKQSCTISSRTFFTFRFLLPLTVSHVFQSLSDNSHVFQSSSDNMVF